MADIFLDFAKRRTQELQGGGGPTTQDELKALVADPLGGRGKYLDEPINPAVEALFPPGVLHPVETTKQLVQSTPERIEARERTLQPLLGDKFAPDVAGGTVALENLFGLPLSFLLPKGVSEGLENLVFNPIAEGAGKGLKAVGVPEPQARAGQELVHTAVPFALPFLVKGAGAGVRGTAKAGVKTFEFARGLGERGSTTGPKKPLSKPPMSAGDIAKLSESEFAPKGKLPTGTQQVFKQLVDEADAAKRAKRPEPKPIELTDVVEEGGKPPVPPAVPPVPTGPTPPPSAGRTFSIKNAAVDAELQSMGFPAATRGEHAAANVWNQRAQAVWDKDPTVGKRLVDELRASPRPLKGEEAFLMDREYATRIAERDAAQVALKEAQKTGDQLKVSTAQTSVDNAVQRFREFADADASAGTQNAYGLALRQQRIKQDFSLAEMERQREIVNVGKELTPQQKAQTAKLSEGIQQTKVPLDKRTSDVQRAARAEASLRRAIKDAEAKLSGRKPSRGQPVDTPETRALRAQLEDLKRQYQEVTDILVPPKTPAERATAAYKKRLQTMTKKYEEALATKDFSPRHQTRLQLLDDEARGLLVKFEQAKEAWQEALVADKLAQRSKSQRLFDAGTEMSFLSRTLLTALEQSYLLRQGGPFALANPLLTFRKGGPFRRSLEIMRNPEKMRELQLEIKSDSKYPLAKRDKLELTEFDPLNIARMEEEAMSTTAMKIPGVRRTQAAFTGFLNAQRFTMYKYFTDKLGRNGNVSPVEGRAVANFINVWTGRASVGTKLAAFAQLNALFFAPRFVISRYQMVLGQPLLQGYRASARVGNLIAGEHAKLLGALAMIYGIMRGAGAEIETDPRSSDYGKVRFGNQRLDPTFGLSSAIVFGARIATGKSKSVRTGRILDKRDQARFGSDTGDTIWRYLWGKLAPVPGAAVNLAVGKNVVGEQTIPEQELLGLFFPPLAYRDSISSMKDQGLGKATILQTLSYFGMSLQSFDPWKRRVKDRRKFLKRME